MNLWIRGGRLIDPANNTDTITDLHIHDGKVVTIGPYDGTSATVIDAKGLIVCPGFVDLSVSLRKQQKASVSAESRAAAAGGITSMCCLPDTSPVIDSSSAATLVQDLAHQAGFCNVWPIGALTQGLAGSQLSEMGTLKEAGCIGMSNLRQPFENTRVLLRCLEYAASYNVMVFFNPVEHSLADDGCVHEGPFATRLGLKGVPETAETVALTRDLLLVEQTGVRAHFGQLTCARSVDLIANAQKRGLPVTADVCIHHLLGTEADVQNFNSLNHIQPPLRTQRDREALQRGVQDGIISAICSHHHPHPMSAKMAPFAATEPGISTLDTLLPQSLKLVENNVLTLTQMIERLTCGPAQAANLKSGSLAVGDIADICIFDADEDWLVSAETLNSSGHNTPLMGTELRGRVKHTLLAGRQVYPLRS
ncbi:Dihydroorotase [gamma proteobacterium IMCC2047]|nr:Dihydroorotase [gamma proteobacterium IMCC2047]